SMIFSAPFRKLMVPVMIKSVRVDPKVMFAAIARNRSKEEMKEKEAVQEQVREWRDMNLDEGEQAGSILAELDQTNEILDQLYERFHIYKSMMPFYVDSNAKLLVTHGLEVENVMAFPIPRKVDNQDLGLDSYEFLPNEDLCAIDPCDRQTLNQYLELCKSMASIIKRNGAEKIKCDYNYRNIGSDVIQGYRMANNESHVMFRALDKIMQAVAQDDHNNNTAVADNNIAYRVWADMQDRREFDLNKDLIHQIQRNERLIRSLVDIVNENLVPQKTIKVLEINAMGGAQVLAREVEKYVADYHMYPIDVEYKLAVTAKEGCPESLADRTA
ncbi:unnamed protein product, partial [Medioppia subpectinata]